MKCALVKVAILKCFNEEALIKDGFKKADEGVYMKNVEQILLTYKVKEGYSEIILQSTSGLHVEFELEKVWNSIWKKPFIPYTVAIYTKEDILPSLRKNKWVGVCEDKYFVADKETCDPFVIVGEGEKTFNQFYDNRPCNITEYIQKLNKLNLVG